MVVTLFGRATSMFDDTFVPHELDAWFGARDCPACITGRLERVESLDQPHWLCRSCGQCWRAEHGRLRSTDPLTCRGCAARPKTECISVLLRTFPRFGAGSPTTD
jgi:hypothetical protein